MPHEVVIAYEPNSPHQEAFHDSDAYERVLFGGYGCGKTIAGCAEVLRLAMMNPGQSGLIVVANLPLANKTVLMTLPELLENSNIKFKHNQQKHFFYLIDFRHTIFYASAEVPDSLKGSNVVYVYFDELSQMNKKAYDRGVARARVKDCQTGNKIFATTTPDGLGWVYEEFFITERRKGMDRCIIFGRTVDNRDLPASYVQSLMDRYTPDEQKMYLYGEFVKTRDGLVLPEWNDDFIVSTIPEDANYPHYQHYVSMDLGVRDKTVILFGTYYFMKSLLVIEDEIWMQGSEMTTLRIAEYVKKLESKLWGSSDKIYRVADFNNPLLVQDLQFLHDISIAPTKKDSPEALVNNTRVFVKSGRLNIVSHCEELLGCLKFVKWNANKEKADFERSTRFGHGDALSALLIMIRNLDTSTNPIPQYIYNPFMYHQRVIEIKQKNQVLEDAFYE